MKRFLTTLLLITASLCAKESNTAIRPLSISNVSETITLNGTVAGTVQFTLYDLQGRRVHRMRQVVHAGVNELTLPASIQKNRVMVMEMSDGHWKYSEQLILN